VPLTYEQVVKDLETEVSLPTLIQRLQAMRHPIERNITYDTLFFRVFLMPIIDADTVIGTVLLVENTTEQKALERARDEFFSIASHELRTPLTVIRGNISLALQTYPEQFKDQDLHQMLVDSHDASIRLIDIVNDFLDTSRLEQRQIKFNIEAVDTLSLMQEMLREYEPTLAQHQFTMKIDLAEQTLPKVMADRNRLHQILTNLVGNAVKYTPDSGTIILKPQVTGSLLKIQVIDTGQGIPVQSRHLLFRKFQQASNNILTRDSTRSTGLGLYISRLMAEAMHGRLYLEKSEVGQGSTFTLELPLSTASVPQQAQTPPLAPTTPTV
jgi:signal transduction histidine kinase